MLGFSFDLNYIISGSSSVAISLKSAPLALKDAPLTHFF